MTIELQENKKTPEGLKSTFDYFYFNQTLRTYLTKNKLLQEKYYYSYNRDNLYIYLNDDKRIIYHINP